ncbi:MAG TPA: flagellar motor switch protein FliN [Pirellulales bacterium]|jgi:flagellar motor switch protein FliN/FliY|nr:flagellar motor switch protein FliN [Pirellulales bacterium]
MAGESEQISQDEIEKLLSQSKVKAASGPSDGTEAAAPLPGAALPVQYAASGQLPAEGPAQSAVSESGAPQAATAPPPRGKGTTMGTVGQGGLPAGDIDFLFRQAEQALASVQGPLPTPPGVTPYKLVDFGGAPATTERATLDLLRDVELDLKIELGRTNMYLEDVLRLSKGAVVPLDRLAGDPVDIYVNGRLIARGEVLILNDNFCVRVAELVAGESPAAAESNR